MSIDKLKLTDKLEFEQLVIDNMGKYDGFSIEDPEWEEQIKNNNVVGIYILDKLVAAYYFTEKVFKSIRSFSKKMHLQPEVFLNNEKWTAFYRSK